MADVCAFCASPPPPSPTPPGPRPHANRALFVYVAAGDWLQGPYVYALYQHYGYEVKDIGRLFIAGFGSSMVFGTIVGSLADKQLRRCCAASRGRVVVAAWDGVSPGAGKRQEGRGVPCVRRHEVNVCLEVAGMRPRTGSNGVGRAACPGLSHALALQLP